MSAAGCQPDTPVSCCAHSDMPEHTTGNGFAPVRETSAVRLCAISCLCQYKLAVVETDITHNTHAHTLLTAKLLYAVQCCMRELPVNGTLRWSQDDDKDDAAAAAAETNASWRLRTTIVCCVTITQLNRRHNGGWHGVTPHQRCCRKMDRRVMQ